jgi:hypothetical protein
VMNYVSRFWGDFASLSSAIAIYVDPFNRLIPFLTLIIFICKSVLAHIKKIYSVADFRNTLQSH